MEFYIDRRIPIKLKEIFCGTAKRALMLCGSEYCTIKKQYASKMRGELIGMLTWTKVNRLRKGKKTSALIRTRDFS